MGKKKWKLRPQAQPYYFIFSPETVQLTLQAIAIFEQPLQRADHRRDKVFFAEEVVQGLKHKLRRMLADVGYLCLATFDENEKVIIQQSMLLYTLDLLDEPVSPHQERRLRQCNAISRHFQTSKTHQSRSPQGRRQV